jgi:hypothetical protein
VLRRQHERTQASQRAAAAVRKTETTA